VGHAADRTEGRMFATRSVVHSRHGMVAASHPLAVQIGIDVLKSGGSAVDSAIAVNAALGFLEPVACGIGGDLFAIVWSADEAKLYGLNASGNVDPNTAVGRTANVYLTVPANASGQGKVTLELQGRTVEFRAVTDGDEIPTGSVVAVTKFLSPGVAHVARVADTAAKETNHA